MKAKVSYEFGLVCVLATELAADEHCGYIEPDHIARALAAFERGQRPADLDHEAVATSHAGPVYSTATSRLLDSAIDRAATAQMVERRHLLEAITAADAHLLPTELSSTDWADQPLTGPVTTVTWTETSVTQAEAELE
ncbi:hypothetical protein [Actinomadura terrae]|uniref:hypothetical protein n=1 Tax=Actinomadura terrae TaxID=604353 RepID=UPI001FA77DA1|nr:hypothetical protein [Actinomadura terrae]